jgi:hypothetical protein
LNLSPLAVCVGLMSKSAPRLSYAQPNRFALWLDSMGGHPSSFISLLVVSAGAAHVDLI